MTTKEVIKTTQYTTTVYVADDGEEFSQEFYCRQHERELKLPVIEKAIAPLLIYQGCALCNEDRNIDIFKLNSKADYDLVLEWVRTIGAEEDYLSPPKSYPCKYILSYDYSETWMEEWNVDGVVKYMEEMLSVLKS